MVAGTVAAALALTACGGSDGDDAADEGGGASGAETSQVQVQEPGADSEGVALVAEAKGPQVAVFGAQDDPQPAQTLSNPNENGAPLVFLVKEQSGDWLNVHLPVRPNGSTGWVKAADVSVASNPYRMEIQLSAHRLTVYKQQEVVLDEPIGVGTAEAPTPGGSYYIKELLQPPDPNGAYGPYAYGLSGFSNVLTDFAGGDGVIGVHGTNEPDAIGTDVSHGCIRLRNEAISELAPVLPLGTPVTIVA